ncbi:MAG TPA: prohibitin family protein [Arenimonas sp.]|uniref:prohibitin family protein n=1 Tax=Arenimonas sp. TaxID=1872635 RepID=UPI002C43DB1E|nr:prohibitin family protein [Arenimonas sp.]HMB57924.1 prohibitin family protein [Arenimonas sp.]
MTVLQTIGSAVKGRFPWAWLTLALVVLVVATLFFGSWYTIDQGERGVHLRNGAVVGSADPGLGFKVPIIDSIKRIPVQNLTTMYDKVSAYSSDQQTAEIRVSVSFHVPPADVIALYSEYGSVEGLTSRIIDRQVPTQVENVFGQYTAISAVQNRVTFVKDVTRAIREAVKGPVVIDGVQIENIDFSDAYEKSIELRMQAEVLVQTEKQNLEKEKVQAQIAVTQANGQADSSLARARADAESTRIKGEAQATAIKARAAALAQNQDLVELTKAERWNGVLPTTMIPNAAIPFLNSNR